MPNQSGKVVLVLVLALLILGVIVYFFSPGFKKQPEEQLTTDFPIGSLEEKQATVKPQANKKQYQSTDLEISFEYPAGWFVNEKNYFLMITSYETKIGRNDQPNDSQVEIALHRPGGCHETIDENLKDPACGEGGPKVKPNEIVTKEVQDINGAKFYKYLIKYPNGEQTRFYFLEKGDRVLQIDKKPDPSMFEKEFEEIIKSLKFD